MSIVLDGKKTASRIRKEIKAETERLKEITGKVPGIAVLIVGDDSASEIYVKSKHRTAKKLGFKSELIKLPGDTKLPEIVDSIKTLNKDDSIDAILVQLPLPDGLKTWEVLDNLSLDKDVDCFLPASQGKLVLGLSEVSPCTPMGIIKILDDYEIEIAGKEVVVVGRSFIVGKPMASLLTHRNATVTICHSKTKDIKSHLLRADIVVAALGKPCFVTKDMVKEGAVLIDVGINYIDNKEDAKKMCLPEEFEKFEGRGYAITGDIHPEAFEKSKAYTPVPGGVGATTVTMLMYNTLQLFKIHNKDKIG